MIKKSIISKKIRFELIVILLIVFAGALLRLVDIGKVPGGLYLDEVLHGLDAYSILKTGKDIYGHTFPLTFQSVSYNPPLYPYLLVPLISIFGLSAWVVRLPTAISGIASIIFIYLLTKELVGDKKSWMPLLSAFVLSFSYWQIHLTRVAFLASFGIIFPLVATYLFIKSLKRHGLLVLSALFFGLGTQVHYDGYKLISPIIFLLLFVFSWQKIRRVFDKRILAAVALIWLVTIFLNWYAYHFFNAGFRVGALSGVNYQEVLTQYLKTYSFDFLFLSGDTDLMRNPWRQGQLLLILSPFLIIGLFRLNRLNKMGLAVVAVWGLAAPLPSAIAGLGTHALRNSLLIVPIAIILALGLEWLTGQIKKAVVFPILLCFVFLIFFLGTFNKLYFYWGYYPKLSFSIWGEPSRAAARYMLAQKDNYERVFVTDSYNTMLAFFAFETRLAPEKLQHAILFPEKINNVAVKRIDNLYFVPIEEEKSQDWYYLFPRNTLIIDPLFYLRGEQFRRVNIDGNAVFQAIP